MLKKAMSKELCEFLTDMEADLSQTNQEAIKRRYVTTIIMRITLFVMVVLAILDWLLLDKLTVAMIDTLETVDSIGENFSHISHDMLAITVSVKNIDNNMMSLTPMSKNLFTIHDNMGQLSQEMHKTVDIVSTIDSHVHQIDTSMNYVDYRMNGVSQDMHSIGSDMHKMSKPAGWMNKMMPW